MSRRYEKKSTVLTTNLAFRDWPTRATVAARDDKLERRHSRQLSFRQPGWRATIT
ncbi:MAG: hypothetical protein ABI488_06740 [Polyangiaceae bacterium]